MRPIAYGSKVLSDTEMKYGAPKAEMFAVVTFVEKYRAYLGSEPFKLRVDNRALSWLKTYSMDQSYIGRWIVRLDGYNMIIEHRTRDKHQNADSLSKKTEFYERQEQREADIPEIKDGFSFMDKETHEVTRNLSEPSDQTIMHIDVYADYLSCISPQTTSRALRTLLTRGGSKSVRVDNRYTEAYGPHEVMLNIDGINIYTKTMITCDEDLIGQIYVGKEELKVRSIGHCAMLEEDAMHIGTEADVTGHVLDISGKKTQLRGLLDTGAVLSVIPFETWERMGFDKGDLIDSRIRLSAANKGALWVLGRTPIIALNLGERNLWMSFLVVENLDESDQFILGRDFIRNFDATIDLNNAMFRIRNPDRRYAIKPVNLIMANETKAPVFLSRRVRLKANEAAIVGLRMKIYNELSDNKQVCIVPNPNSQSAAVLGRSFSITKRASASVSC